MNTSEQFRENCEEEERGINNNQTLEGNNSTGCFGFLADFISNIREAMPQDETQ